MRNNELIISEITAEIISKITTELTGANWAKTGFLSDESRQSNIFQISEKTLAQLSVICVLFNESVK